MGVAEFTAGTGTTSEITLDPSPPDPGLVGVAELTEGTTSEMTSSLWLVGVAEFKNGTSSEITSDSSPSWLVGMAELMEGTSSDITLDSSVLLLVGVSTGFNDEDSKRTILHNKSFDPPHKYFTKGCFNNIGTTGTVYY